MKLQITSGLYTTTVDFVASIVCAPITETGSCTDKTYIQTGIPSTIVAAYTFSDCFLSPSDPALCPVVYSITPSASSLITSTSTTQVTVDKIQSGSATFAFTAQAGGTGTGSQQLSFNKLLTVTPLDCASILVVTTQPSSMNKNIPFSVTAGETWPQPTNIAYTINNEPSTLCPVTFSLVYDDLTDYPGASPSQIEADVSIDTTTGEITLSKEKAAPIPVGLKIKITTGLAGASIYSNRMTYEVHCLPETDNSASCGIASIYL